MRDALSRINHMLRTDSKRYPRRPRRSLRDNRCGRPPSGERCSRKLRVRQTNPGGVLQCQQIIPAELLLFVCPGINNKLVGQTESEAGRRKADRYAIHIKCENQQSPTAGIIVPHK